MTTRRFFTALLGCTSLAALAVLSLSAVAALRPYTLLSWSSVLLFVVLSIGLFFLGKLGIRSTNKLLFSNLMMLGIGVKMLLAVATIMVYQFLAHPASRFFVLPFFVIYLIFTIFEVYFLVKLGKTV